MNGLRATQNNYQLDGALYINRFFDSVPILPNPDALREFTIQAANFSSEYGGAGALVLALSRRPARADETQTEEQKQQKFGADGMPHGWRDHLRFKNHACVRTAQPEQVAPRSPLPGT